MGYKLNQDFLENLFGMIRLNGGSHDHPSPLQALDRLRLIIIGKNLSQQLKRNQNAVNDVTGEEFIMSRLFRNMPMTHDASKPGEEKREDDESSEDENFHMYKKSRTLAEDDGAQYVWGYIARGSMKTHPDIGSYTHENDDNTEKQLNKENYVEDLSHGGLVKSSETFVDVAEQLEAYFNYIHNTGKNAEQPGFRNPKGIKARSIRKMTKKFPEVPNDIIKSFVTKRINIRVRHMKKIMLEQKVHKYKIAKKPLKKPAGQTNQSDERCAVVGKNKKKLKHFIN